MVFNCGLCHGSEEYCMSFCSNCEKIENLIRIYKVEKVVEILEKVLVAKQFKADCRTEAELEEVEKIKTRSSAK